MNIKTEVSISANSAGTINIRIKDAASRQIIVEVFLKPKDFALAITGLYLTDQPAQTGDLSVIGKQRITENRSITCPLTTYDRDKLSQWLLENAQEPGWSVNSYLGSQSSVSRQNGQTLLNYSVYRYVSVED